MKPHAPESRPLSESLVSSTGGDIDATISCRTRSQLPLVPDIIQQATLRRVSAQSFQLDLLLNPNNISFNPGVAPQLCVTSPDGAVYLPTLSENVPGAPQVVPLSGRVIFSFSVANPNLRTLFGFRLKFEEQRIQPRKVVVQAFIPPGFSASTGAVSLSPVSAP